jgi:hypothetical protein
MHNFQVEAEKARRRIGTLQTVLARELEKLANEIMAESKKLCPVDTGTLRSSGLVQKPVIEGNMISVTLGYGDASCGYAVYVHENPRAGQTGGVSPSGRKYGAKRWARKGQWKYLETPLVARVNDFPRVVDYSLELVFKRLEGG